MSLYRKDKYTGEYQTAHAPIINSRRLSAWAMTDRLAYVAAIYGLAVEEGEPPTKTVAKKLGISHSYAANLVAKARKSGQLTVPPPDPSTPVV